MLAAGAGEGRAATTAPGRQPLAVTGDVRNKQSEADEAEEELPPLEVVVPMGVSAPLPGSTGRAGGVLTEPGERKCVICGLAARDRSSQCDWHRVPGDDAPNAFLVGAVGPGSVVLEGAAVASGRDGRTVDVVFSVDPGRDCLGENARGLCGALLRYGKFGEGIVVRKPTEHMFSVL